MYHSGPRPLLSHFFREPDFRSRLELAEIGVNQAVPVKVDAAPVRCLDASGALFRTYFRHMAAWHGFVMLHLAAAEADLVLYPAFHSFECIANGDIDIFMGMMQIPFPACDEFRPGQLHIDSHMVEITLPMVFMRRFHDYTATYDIAGKMLQLFRVPADTRLDGLRWRHVAKADLQRQLHEKTQWLKRPNRVCPSNCTKSPPSTATRSE